MQKKEGQLSMSLRGGKRPRAGRPKIGKTKPLKVVLPDAYWDLIDDQIAQEVYAGYNDFLRSAVADKIAKISDQFCESCQLVLPDVRKYDGAEIDQPLTSMQLCSNCARQLKSSIF